MIVTDETKALAQDILDLFISTPGLHEQLSYWGVPDPDLGSEDIRGWDADEYDSICGTTLCVAGSAVYLNQGMNGLRDHAAKDSSDWNKTAGDLLGLESLEAEGLFLYTSNQEAVDALTAIAAGDQNKFQEIIYAADAARSPE